MAEHETRILDGREIELSHLDRPLFPEAGLAKRDLVDYYDRIADTMLPYLRDRPLSLQRFPEGIGQQGFYQKEAPAYYPAWIERVAVRLKESGERQPQLLCQDRASLVYLANQDCVTLHPWLSRRDALDRPDRLVFDLDPPDGPEGFALVLRAAKGLREILEARGLRPFVMTTGSRGLHVVLALDGSADFDASRAFARARAEELAAREPEAFTTEVRKAKREGRLFLDSLNNAYGQTTVAPYAVRARPGAPVATPLDWSELDRSGLGPQSYHIGNLFRRLGQKADPWRELGREPARLDGG